MRQGVLHVDALSLCPVRASRAQSLCTHHESEHHPRSLD
jgi:hypothetical protein